MNGVNGVNGVTAAVTKAMDTFHRCPLCEPSLGSVGDRRGDRCRHLSRNAGLHVQGCLPKFMGPKTGPSSPRSSPGSLRLVQVCSTETGSRAGIHETPPIGRNLQMVHANGQNESQVGPRLERGAIARRLGLRPRSWSRPWRQIARAYFWTIRMRAMLDGHCAVCTARHKRYQGKEHARKIVRDRKHCPRCIAECPEQRRVSIIPHPLHRCTGERAELHMAMPLLEAAVDSRKERFVDVALWWERCIAT